ncbi:MAG TPA: TadE/TadG family type IV pilus assembly protein [Lacipirellula sp.]
MIPLPLRLLRDEGGAALVEMSIVATMFLIVTFGLVEFSFALWQWNSASKATQLGARLAAVSDPVWDELTSDLTLAGVGGTVGGGIVTFTVRCDGADATCTVEENGCMPNPDSGSGTCPSFPSRATFDPEALDTIVYGREGASDAEDGTCNVGPDGFPGMCDIFRRVKPENVSVRYYYSGLGFPGRPGGPVPTITVRLTDMTFDFVVLNALLGFGPITMPDFEVTMTGEDLCVQSPSSPSC